MALKVQSRMWFARPHLLWSKLVYGCSCSDVPAALVSRRGGARGSSSEFESAIRSLRRNPEPERLAHLLDSTSDFNLALRIFRWASYQGMPIHTVDTYARMIAKLGDAGNHDEVGVFLKEMVKLDVPGLEKVMNDLVNFLSSKNRFDEAFLVIQHASSGNIKLPVSSCNGVLCGLVKEGRGLRLFMRAYMEVVKAGVLPDVETLNWLIEILCEAGRLDLALVQFDKMSKKRCTPNSHTFKILITALCSHGRADESVDLFDKMLQLRCIPDSCFYVKVLPLFCKFNKLKQASKLHQMMKEDKLQLDQYLYGALIRCFCQNQLLDDAVTIFNEMIASGHYLMSTFVDIVECYCTLGQFHKAVSFLEENDVAEIETYNVLLRALCKSGRLPDSVSYLTELHARGLVNCNSWNIVITQFCNKGNIRRASELICRMIVSSCTADESTYSSVVSCYCKLGLYKNALDIFRRVSVSNLSLNSESFSQLIEGLCHMNKIQEAAEVFNYHCKRGCSITSESLEMLIQESCMAGTGMIRQAIKMRSLAVCTGTSCTFTTYNTIFQAVLHLKKKDVLLLFAQMLMEGFLLNEYTYNCILHCFLTKETSFEAAILFNKMVKDGFVPDQATFELLVPDMACSSLLNMVSESLLTVVNMDGMMSPRISNIIIYGLIKEGFKSEACKFLDQMIEKGWVPDSKTHSILLGSIGREEPREVDEFYQAVDDDNVSNILLGGLD
ncbi:hypothetical protein ABZP36_017856 [Zizania latifolia]